MKTANDRSLRVAIMGTGYVGLTTGVALAWIGHEVICVDKDLRKVELLQSGKSPIHEDGMEELLNSVSGRMSFTQDTSKAVSDGDVILIAVGTPQKENGEANTDYVEQAAREVCTGLLPNHAYTLIIKSTVPVGSNRRVSHIVKEVLKERKLLQSVRVAVVSNPEFLREGMALHDTLYPDRIVVGSEDSVGVDALRQLYQPLLEQTFDPPSFLPRPEGYVLPPMVTTSPTSAELIKYASNAFLATKISFINEIASLCDKVGGNVVDVARGMGLDTRIGPRFLQAGLGWGGSCFPKDTAALCAMGKEHNCSTTIISATREVNAHQRLLAVEKLQEVLKGVRGRVIGLLGLAFKPGTDDLREAPSLDIVRFLADRGAHVRVHDPIAMANARKALVGLEVKFVDDVYILADGADALVLVTEWPEYRQLHLHRLAEQMRTPVFLDGRNMFSPEQVRQAGLTYLGVGT